MSIIFFGTPEFAVESLKALVDAKFDVVAVVTAPDKPAGRGQHLQPSPVKIFAETCGFAVLQHIKLKDPSFLEELRLYNADLNLLHKCKRHSFLVVQISRKN